MVDKIKVEGLKELRTALRKIDKEAPKGLRLAFNNSAKFLIDKVRPQFPVETGKAAKSLKLRSSQTESRIAFGGRAAPWAPWLDFGGRVGRHKSVRRAFIKEGRYLYPTYNANQPQFQKITEQALNDLIQASGLDK